MDPCDPIINLVVGDGSKTVHAHQGILCLHSDLFKNVLKWDFGSVDSYTLHLPDHALNDTASYVRWLYSDSEEIDYDYDARIRSPAASPELYKYLVETYLYSQKVKDEGYGRAALLGIMDTQIVFNCIPSVDMLRTLYDATIPGCLARRLMTQFVAYEYFRGTHLNYDIVAAYPHELLADVVASLSGLQNIDTRPWDDAKAFLHKLKSQDK